MFLFFRVWTRWLVTGIQRQLHRFESYCRGYAFEKAEVDNLLSSLNSVNMSFDTANSFGTSSVGQTIAAYNGQALYSAVYPQCRDAVSTSCNTASLQRAVNAYLMAIEQDCNTVQTAINAKQKETHAAIRESSAMLDMARAENHQKHNSDNIATCLANVESAILSEEVCGANYHKCLDNGEYPGASFAGIAPKCQVPYSIGPG